MMDSSPSCSSARVGACGGNYSAPSGVIYSPDFPDTYGPGRVCYWTIQVPGASAILFNFTFFDISDQTDMVELLDGYTNRVLARFDLAQPATGAGERHGRLRGPLLLLRPHQPGPWASLCCTKVGSQCLWSWSCSSKDIRP